MTNDQFQTILRAFESVGAMLTDQAEELKKARKDIQEVKTSQRWDKRRGLSILKRIKGSR